MALTDKQLKAIELLKSGMMQAEVSQIVGVSVRTLQRCSIYQDWSIGDAETAAMRSRFARAFRHR